MSERVSMPALGESVTEGTVTRWLKSVGDSVEVDEPLLEVSTDKVDTEIPSPVAGTLQEILAEEDETVEVGADLCVVGDGNGGDSSDSGGSDAQADEESGQAEESGDEGGSDEQERESEDSAASEDTSDSSDSSDSKEESSEDSGSGASSGSSGGGGGSEGETVTMPALGESVTEGTVTRWLKSEGDSVEVDEPLLEVSTDKVDTEIPSPVAGVLTSILAGEDETVEVGGELAVIGGESSGGGSDEGSSQSEPEQDEEKSEEPAEEKSEDKPAEDEKDDKAEEESSDDLGGEQDKQEKAAQEASESTGTSDADDSGEAVGVGTTSAESGSTSHKDADGDGTRDVEQREQSSSQGQDVSAYVTPLVRKLAAQHDVDLGSLTGTGVGGRIRKQDVLDAAKAKEEQSAASAPAEEKGQERSAEQPAASAPAPSPESEAKRGTTEKMSRLRKVIATRMVESLQTSAQLTTVIEVDVTKISRLRKRSKDDFLKREGTKLSFMPFFAMAAIEALKEHPIVNASVEDDSIVYHAAEHLGVAVDTPRGLLVPVIKDAGDLNIAGLARKIADLAERTRDNKVTPDELSGGTFTLTNTGSRGALFDTPIINQPNVGILGTGAVVKRPVVIVDEDGMETIAIRDMVYLAISYDHRVVDGADAARFLATMKERLEDGKFEV
ncbi:Dihydrolipoamide acyltransferase component of branched-chain alpha-keto acid dehydrogenase complex [Serinicoccus hydrothermalis]|uniref:Dihydrolipoamide acetyltransferase component of pyruvate dehydrogenase complex n=1 Tax=Serinicoccus hydrothermalis TaxID=1758689 RepID=A0A1B1NA04_9MICO|nr:2-oxoglutarate dehydrogenase, E2 component, dihydrolipoamide succinyltransferase [Serinicoccus hydrothermalis]ANS78241.1 Dihydrolipoamide acyltransferase component of branched-chain alpha-keto acid dehydrogenase complex [Serinicoccus hydrothermalis]